MNRFQSFLGLLVSLYHTFLLPHYTDLNDKGIRQIITLTKYLSFMLYLNFDLFEMLQHTFVRPFYNYLVDKVNSLNIINKFLPLLWYA